MNITVCNHKTIALPAQTKPPTDNASNDPETQWPLTL